MVTFVLVSWRRPKNIPLILKSLAKIPWITHKVVWDNSGLLDGIPLDAEVISSPSNVGTYGRYLAARSAVTELIATQDDDCIVDNWEELFARQYHSGLLVCNVTEGHRAWCENRVDGKCMPALVGWGAVFDRESVEVLTRYVDKYGEDSLLHTEADRIFTMLLENRHEFIEVVPNNLPGAQGAEALYRRRNHWKVTHKAMTRAAALCR